MAVPKLLRRVADFVDDTSLKDDITRLAQQVGRVRQATLNEDLLRQGIECDFDRVLEDHLDAAVLVCTASRALLAIGATTEVRLANGLTTRLGSTHSRRKTS